ncbi:ABC transporter permease [Flammeovirgaceae bacterium SG7u.111]|nr:ABC transporter permease [Flammeovirgaceae bacterium SG7u.132]WPO33162.1 ABC transporter permease [Flammeovirgaceae bacterium SG7u.111]
MIKTIKTIAAYNVANSMKNTLYIASKYILHNKIKTSILVACVTIILFLPAALEVLLNASEEQLMSRAKATPLLVGSKGSALDLCMNALYFDNESPELISLEGTKKIDASELASAVPIYNRFSAQGFPIIGTSLDYFKFRKLKLTNGRKFTMIGECIIGAKVAEALQLGVGQSIVSSPENLFDLAGIYPLKMNIVGVLAPSHSPDDLGIFTDLKTTWIIQGLGHGHQDVTKLEDESLIASRSDSVVQTTSKLMNYNEITEENIGSFHFHGDLTTYPITAVIAFPKDQKSGTLLQGKYLQQEEKYQIVKPTTVIDGLLQNIFRIRNVLDAVIAIVSFATFLALFLVFVLSTRLREAEIQTTFKIGGRKGTIAKFLLAEILISTLISATFAALLIAILHSNINELVRMLFMG